MEKFAVRPKLLAGPLTVRAVLGFAVGLGGVGRSTDADWVLDDRQGDITDNVPLAQFGLGCRVKLRSIHLDVVVRIDVLMFHRNRARQHAEHLRITQQAQRHTRRRRRLGRNSRLYSCMALVARRRLSRVCDRRMRKNEGRRSAESKDALEHRRCDAPGDAARLRLRRERHRLDEHALWFREKSFHDFPPDTAGKSSAMRSGIRSGSCSASSMHRSKNCFSMNGDKTTLTIP